MTGMAKQRAGRFLSNPVLWQAFVISLLFLSVFICVHPLVPDSFSRRSTRDAGTLTGIDVLEAQNFAPLAGKRVGLITNQTGIDRRHRSSIDLLAHAPGVKLVALFSPEHGIRGVADERHRVAFDGRGHGTAPVYSLYGDTICGLRTRCSRVSTFWCSTFRMPERASTRMSRRWVTQ